MGVAFGCCAFAFGCRVLPVFIVFVCRLYVFMLRKKLFWGQTKNRILMLKQQMSLCFYVFGNAPLCAKSYRKHLIYLPPTAKTAGTQTPERHDDAKIRLKPKARQIRNMASGMQKWRVNKFDS